MTISLSDYFQNKSESPSASVRENAEGLLEKVNFLLADPQCPLHTPVGVRSGWRPAWYNKQVPNAAPNSKHITGNAIDLNDDDAVLDDWLDLYDVKIDGIIRNEMLEKYGLYRESALATKSWCHLQDIAPRSGNRTFNP